MVQGIILSGSGFYDKGNILMTPDWMHINSSREIIQLSYKKNYQHFRILKSPSFCVQPGVWLCLRITARFSTHRPGSMPVTEDSLELSENNNAGAETVFASKTDNADVVVTVFAVSDGGRQSSDQRHH